MYIYKLGGCFVYQVSHRATDEFKLIVINGRKIGDNSDIVTVIWIRVGDVVELFADGSVKMETAVLQIQL